jgi:hypothetical protein
MFWPFKRKTRPLEKWYAPRIQFLGEQYGQPESELKAQLSTVLARSSHVQCAYLARAIFNDSPTVDVVLAISSTQSSDDLLINELAGVFNRKFRTD